MIARNELHWFVGRVKSCQERKVAEALSMQGVEYYLPVQRVKRQWSDRIKWIDKLLLPHYIFIRTTDALRVSLLQSIYGLCSYMAEGIGHPSVIPDIQMSRFRQMVERTNEAFCFSREPLAPGDEILILEGPFVGMTCEVVEIHGSRKAVVRLGMLGAAMVTIKTDAVQKTGMVAHPTPHE